MTCRLIDGRWQLTKMPKFGTNVAAVASRELQACEHRGPFELVDCRGCRGRVQIKVYECLHFGEKCTPDGRQVNGKTTRSCRTCEAGPAA